MALSRRRFGGARAARARPACARPAAPRPAGDAARRRVTIGTPFRPNGQPTYARLLARLAEAHPELAPEPVPPPPGDPFAVAVSAGAIDLLWVDGPAVVELGAVGGVVELAARARADGLAADQFWPPAWAQGGWQGRIYGLPITADPNFRLFWNRPSIAAAGLDPARAPATIDELGDWGVVPRAVYGVANALFTWAGAFGAVLYDEATDRVTADHPGAVAAIEWMAAQDRRLGKRPPIDPAEERHPFAYGMQTVAPLGSWELPDLRRGAIDYGVGSLPPGAEWVGGWHLGLTAGPRLDDAWRLAGWVTATREGALAQGELHLAFSALRDNPWLPAAERDPDLAGFAAVLRRTTRHRPAHPAGALFMELLGQAATDGLRARKPPAEALAMVAGATQRKLDTRKRAIPLG
jgi:ABC-type glycerol-3-phosphate transport system substrate-binding protein